MTDPANSYAAVLNNKTAVDFLSSRARPSTTRAATARPFPTSIPPFSSRSAWKRPSSPCRGIFSWPSPSARAPTGRGRSSSRPTTSSSSGTSLGSPSRRPSATRVSCKHGRAQPKSGARIARQQADLYPLHDAWALYEPVGFSSDMGNMTLPDGDKVASAYLQELVHYIDGQIYPEVAKLRAEISRTNNSPNAVNRLGVLYARYGLTDRAETEFQRAIRTETILLRWSTWGTSAISRRNSGCPFVLRSSTESHARHSHHSPRSRSGQP